MLRFLFFIKERKEKQIKAQQKNEEHNEKLKTALFYWSLSLYNRKVESEETKHRVRIFVCFLPFSITILKEGEGCAVLSMPRFRFSKVERKDCVLWRLSARHTKYGENAQTLVFTITAVHGLEVEEGSTRLLLGARQGDALSTCIWPDTCWL